MTVQDFERIRDEMTDSDRLRPERMAEFVEWTGVDTVFEIIDEVRWGM